ncbi:MAG: ACP S-malonyltransferase [Acidimicrobiales bacterium]
MPRLAVAFPGQGIDPVDLARILTEHAGDPLVEALADRLGTSAWRDLDLGDTRQAQPAILVAGLVAARAGVDPDQVVAVAGHSFGEITALAFAGAIEADAAVDLVRHRAELCHAAHERRPGAMLVVMRVADADLEWIRRQAVAATGASLELAVVNGPGQVVLSGDRVAVDHAAAAVTAQDGVARVLAIGGAYHSPLLAEQVAPYGEAVRAALRAEPRVPLVSCTTQERLTGRDDLVVALSRALVLPVRWVATMEAVATQGVDRVVDAGPGRTLVNLARHTPSLPTDGLSPERSRRGG